MQRVVGAVIAFAGAGVLAWDSPPWDRVLVTFAPRHGVDLSDIVGCAAVFAGVVALWTAPPRSSASGRER